MNLRHIDPRSTEWMETIEAMAERGAKLESGTEAGMELSGDDRAPTETKAPSSTGRFENRVHALGSPPR
jgi:hypothetical protein